MQNNERLIVILGPTACGKTTFACHLASDMNGEIISGDSRQVYRGMDIGTGKDLDDYSINNQLIPYHLIDICEAGAKYNLYEYQRDFLTAYNKVISKGHQPILCGGTGLYIESVVRGYDLSSVPQNPELRKVLEHKTLEELTSTLMVLKEKNNSSMHNKTDVDTAQRAIRAIEIEQYNLDNDLPPNQFPKIPNIIIGLDIDRDERRKRISQRLMQRLNNGMVDEVRRLLDSGISAEDLIYYGLEYKFITEYVIGKRTYEDMVGSLEIAIHQFAKRQMTWFRGMERRGLTIHWIDSLLSMAEKIDAAKKLLFT